MTDKKTQDYWTSYYGEYGEMLVREIPRLIKAAILPEFRRSASNFQVKQSSVIPLGFGELDSGDLRIDGVIKIAYTTGSDEVKQQSRLFVATVSADGELLDIEHRSAPVA